MNSLKRRVLSLLLCVCMVLSAVPTYAFADETASETQPAEETIALVDVVAEETAEVTEAAVMAAEEVTVAVEEVAEVTEEVVEATDEIVEATEEATEATEEVTEVTEEATEATEEATEAPEETTEATEEVTEAPEETIEATEEVTEATEESTEATEEITEEVIEEAIEVEAVEASEEAALAVAEDLYDTSVSNDYFKVISAETYELAPGAVEHELVLNNGEGNDRKVAHIFEVDTYNEDLEVMPGYYGIDKLNPDDLAGDKDRGVWTDKQLTQTVKYYEEELGYNVVGAMNTALAYDSNAPYGYMVWNGVVLGTPEVHKGAQTYLAIDWDGNVELRAMSTPLTGNEKTAIPANFGWLVKDGKMTSTSGNRTDSDASRSMVGVKADGTLVFCLVDGRNGAVSSGLSSYEMSEMMLALGCVNAFNCDGGGSSTFISKRAGESVNTMRSVPSDGSERATINSVILVSNAGATGIFNKALIETEYNYIAPTASMAFSVTGLDTKGFTMDIPADVTYQVAEEEMGTIENGVYTAGAATGTATIQAVYNGEVVSEKVLNVVHPDSFGFTAETTALPMDKTLELELFAKYGEDDWDVCIDGAYTLSLPEENLGSSLDGNVMMPPSDPDMEMKTVEVTVTYNPDPTKKDTISVMFGEASKIIWDFEDGDRAGFMGFEEAKQWSVDNGVSNTLIGSDPLAGQFNEYLSSETKVVTAADGGQVRNGQYALAWTLDNTDTNFANWSYNVLFNVGEKVVFRDTANGINATSLGMWLYIPEGAAGLAFQSQFWATAVADGSTGCKQAHFTFETVSGVRKNLNSCTEADIPANRWVYASIDLTPYSYCSTMDPQETASNSRSPSFIRTYVKPASPAVHTFYIDDITVDYSSAVDDRVAPVIGELQYATQDTTIPVEEAVITSNAVTFSAVVSDNTSLDTASAQIYIDGNKVATQVQGKNMFTTEDVVMDNGSHVVTFEIADKMGNEFQTSARFTVAYAEAVQENGLVYVTGHNDSNAPAESGSVYYVDIMTSDITQVASVELNIKLNNANTWELEQALVAEGYSFEYEVLSNDNRYETFALTSDIHSTDNVAVITLTKTGDCSLTGEQTLVSLPVRLWSWDGYDYVNNKPIDPVGNKPIVTIDYNVLFGCAETVSGEYVSFGGSASVETKMNAVDAVLHSHDEELTVLNQEATCTVNGYENRTYCETCKSVIDWGTKIEAKGHAYKIVEGKLVCDCGAVMSGSGVVSVNGKLYYLIGENLQSGWNAAANEGSVTKWCYADPTTMEVQSGEFTVDGLTYTADESGALVSGVWVENYLGRRYSFGPKFYAKTWATIDGVQYYFGSNAYAFTGYHQIRDNENNKKTPYRWFLFGEDGALVDDMKTYCGFLEVNGELYFLENGIGNTYIGTTKINDEGRADENGSYYYLDESGKVMTGKQWVGSYLQSFSKFPLPTGNYEFDENGKMYDGIVAKEDGTYYYQQGRAVAAGWVKDGNDYYVFSDGGKALVGRNWIGTYLNETSKDPYKVGNFIFDKTGKLANGVAETDDGWYYCVNGVGKEAGLVKIDGNYYLAETNGKLATGYVWVGTYPSNGLLPKGYYEFDENGLIRNGVVEKEDGVYYFETGRPVDTGWLKVGDDYYVFTNGGKALTGQHWVGTYLTETSRNPYKKGNFVFAADGKLASGVVEQEDGWYYFAKGVASAAGLIKLGDDYYLAETDGKLATGRVWVGTYASNGLLNKGYYEFGADGKMLQGIVEKTDGLYYYNRGNTAYLGLIERDGEYYYVNEGGKLEIGRVWVGSFACNGLIAKGYYEFGADGAMLNGFEQLSDGLYYYTMGAAKYVGLVVIDSNLYYIEEGGKVMTGDKVWVGTYASNGLLPKGYYTFADDGKFVK